jgi:hypothetical protein
MEKTQNTKLQSAFLEVMKIQKQMQKDKVYFLYLFCIYIFCIYFVFSGCF